MVQKNKVLTRNEIYEQFSTVQLYFKSLQSKYFIFRGIGFDEQQISIFIPESMFSDFISENYPNLLFETIEKLIFTVEDIIEIPKVHFLVIDKNNKILYQD